MASVAEGIKAQLRNIEKEYGHSIDELTNAIAKSGLTKHAEVVAMLQKSYAMKHAAAHRVSLTARDRLAQPASSHAAPLAPAVELIYVSLLAAVSALGSDVEQAPKKGYVSLRRRKQFAMLQPAAKWVNIGLVLPAAMAGHRLEPAAKWNALFTHRVRVHGLAEVDRELRSWLAEAYKAAG